MMMTNDKMGWGSSYDSEILPGVLKVDSPGTVHIGAVTSFIYKVPWNKTDFTQWLNAGTRISLGGEGSISDVH